MPNDLRASIHRAAAASSSLDDVLAMLQVEDFSELPMPMTPFSSGRLADKRHARACRPVLKRQKAVLCIEDLDADDEPGATPVRSFSRGYRRAASADYPRRSSSAFLSSPSHDTQHECNGSKADEARESIRVKRPNRGLQCPY